MILSGLNKDLSLIKNSYKAIMIIVMKDKLIFKIPIICTTFTIIQYFLPEEIKIEKVADLHNKKNMSYA